MKAFFSDLLPKLKDYSQQLDDLSLIMNKHWVLLEEITSSKLVYIFRPENELLISQNGKVQRAKWEYLSNNSLLVEREDGSYLFKHGFLDDHIFALKRDSTNDYVIFLDENKFNQQFESIAAIHGFLTRKYMEANNAQADANLVHPFNFSSLSENEKQNVTKLKLSNGKLLRIYSTTIKKGDFQKGDKAEIEGVIPKDGNYHYGFTGCVTIEKGVVKW